MPNIRYACLFLCLALLHVPTSQALNVVASARPLALAAQQLLGSGSSVRLLFNSHDAMHHAALRPSAQRALAVADIVLWVGDTNDAGLSLRPQGSSLLVVGGVDELHPWLDPLAMQVLAEQLVNAAIQHDAALEPELQLRFEHFVADLQSGSDDLARLFSLSGQGAVLVTHDAYQPLFERFGLQQLAALRGVHDESPGARRAARFKAAATDPRAACLVADSTRSLAGARNLLGEHTLNEVVLPPEGAPEATSYQAMLMMLGEQLAACLAPSPGTTP